jgi:hypothetical protein
LLKFSSGLILRLLNTLNWIVKPKLLKKNQVPKLATYVMLLPPTLIFTSFILLAGVHAGLDFEVIEMSEDDGKDQLRCLELDRPRDLSLSEMTYVSFLDTPYKD